MSEFGTRNKNVLVVDPHPIVRIGFSALLETEPDLTLAAEASSLRETRLILAQTQCDAVIADLNLRDGDGIELVKDIRSKHGQLPVLIVADQHESIYAERLLSVGANGYIMKQASAKELIAALRRVLQGGIYVSEQIGASMIERIVLNGSRQVEDPIARLSNREMQVLSLISRGDSVRRIASSLNLSVRTVESHRLRIRKKLNIPDTAKLVQFAVNWSLSQH
ncbi:MAG: response regulator transcription factor [Gammaproteobacteria bacterium]|nr:response regulator transcription factor [Gammaproteobacteria bacterium]